ncbi:hypothetical protein BLA60_14570 [Actinophytocola xinjiangensis]|uniref:Uncharacterized protein n=1 Tax=Actinophytocola xinjiangensis TaxID=485602 RepID=A0A7Z1AYZ2_9PSEU|nr:hypothetical protein [Actinophytocola xinjiangensis]OLF11195.1 hypothetical protein BLA60_14570 [Actinophytocola xinjiangensis]
MRPVEAPAPAPTPAPAQATGHGGNRRPPAPTTLLNGHDVERFRARLRDLQADFVDAPERAVEEARALLGEAMTALTNAVNEHHPAPQGDTEGLRVALRHYRSTLDQLLSV